MQLPLGLETGDVIDHRIGRFFSFIKIRFLLGWKHWVSGIGSGKIFEKAESLGRGTGKFFTCHGGGRVVKVFSSCALGDWYKVFSCHEGWRTRTLKKFYGEKYV